MATAEAPPGLDNLDFDASVNSVTIGIEGQRLQSIGILKEEFRNMRNVQTIGDLLEQIAISQKKLEELQKYKRIDSTINCGNEPGDVTVIFRLEERKPQYSVGATLNQEKNLVFSGNYFHPSVFGSHHVFSLEGSYELNASHTFAAILSSPRLLYLPFCRGYFQIFNSTTNFSAEASYFEKVRGISYRIQFPKDRHSLSLGCSLRDMIPSLSSTAIPSQTILTSPLCSLKNSIKYTFLDNCIQEKNLAEEGSLTQASAELALPTGSTSFLKTEFYHYIAKIISSSWSLHYSTSFGGIIPFFNQSVALADKFFMTGANGSQRMLRGFENRGVGPQDVALKRDTDVSVWNRVRDDLGGNFYFNSQLSFLFHPTPTRKEGENTTRPQLFFFGNIGSLIDRLGASTLSNLIRERCAAIGMGLTFPFGEMAWIEASISLPFSSNHCNKQRYVQTGIRLRRADI